MTTHYKYFFYPYHNKGNIQVRINGKKLDLDGTKLSFDGAENSTIKNNKFKFIIGEYGPNTFIFKIPKNSLSMSNNRDLTIEFGHMNFNDWYVNQIELHLDFKTNSENPTLTSYLTYTYDEETGDVTRETSKESFELNNKKVIEIFERE